MLFILFTIVLFKMADRTLPKVNIFIVLSLISVAVCEVVEVYKREVYLDECAAGADGPKGSKGPRGNKGDTGSPETVSTNWNHCTWYHKNDGSDNAQVASCSFTKQYSDTSLYVSLSGNLRVAYTNGACGRWYFTFNGNECSNPNRIEAVVYGGGLSSYNLHRPKVVFGHCNGLSSGSYTVGFHVGNCAGYGYYDTYTGWNSAMHLMIEERTPSPY